MSSCGSAANSHAKVEVGAAVVVKGAEVVGGTEVVRGTEDVGGTDVDGEAELELTTSVLVEMVVNVFGTVIFSKVVGAAAAVLLA